MDVVMTGQGRRSVWLPANYVSELPFGDQQILIQPNAHLIASPPPLHVPADRLHNRKRPITFVFPMNLPVASKTKLQFILGLKVKSKLSSVGSESRETAIGVISSGLRKRVSGLTDTLSLGMK